MRYVFRFPDIGEGITEGVIVEWYVEKGQTVESGDALVKMETDKVVTDIPSPKSGVIAERYGKVGETINVEDPLVEIDIEGVSGEEAQKEAKDKPAAPSEEQVEEKGFGVVGTLEVAGDGAFLPSSDENGDVAEDVKPEKRKGKKALATPVARAMAKDLGVDINEVEGTGPAGRVMKDDIKRHKSKAPQMSASMPLDEEGETVEVEKMSQLRKTIAKNMLKSKHNLAHMHVFDEAIITELVKVRARFKEQFEKKGVKLSYLPFIIKATAHALKKHKALNARMDLEAGKVEYFKFYNIGIAVDTDDGLVVPVIRNVDKKSVFKIAEEIAVIAEKARDRKITLDDMKGGTFTITNFGSLGGKFAAPIINYPQSAILGTGRIYKKPVVENDEIKVGTVLPLSLGVDHGIVDGGEVTRFLNTIMEYISDPVSLLMD